MFEMKICNSDRYKNIKEYYFAIKTGKIISCRNNVTYILADRLSGTGYYYVQLATKEGKEKQELVSRIIATLFIPNNDPEKTIVHHIDHNKLNNHVNNLMWVTYEQNIKYSLMERNYIPGQMSLLDEKPIIKYTIITKVYRNRKTSNKQLSISDIS